MENKGEVEIFSEWVPILIGLLGWVFFILFLISYFMNRFNELYLSVEVHFSRYDGRDETWAAIKFVTFVF